jgi:PhnB protein
LTGILRAAIPYLIVRGATSAIEFYGRAFGLEAVNRIVDDHGKVSHAELRIGEAAIYVADEYPDFENIVGPESLGGTSVIIDLEVTDVDAVFRSAIAAGASALRRPDHPEAGVQSAKVVDPYGHVWLITRVM